MSKKSGLELLLTEVYGVDIPKVFAGIFDLTQFQGLEAEDIAILRAGPDHEAYWDAWDAVLREATHTDEEGHVWQLHQDGDLWMFCGELMTKEERHELFHEYVDCDCDDDAADELNTKGAEITGNLTRDNAGRLVAYVWPGGYPVFYVDAANSTLCPACANAHDTDDILLFRPCASGVNYEDTDLSCDECGIIIPPAYDGRD